MPAQPTELDTLIIVAMHAERKVVVTALRTLRAQNQSAGAVATYDVHGQRVGLAVSGMGIERAATLSAQLLDSIRPKHILVCGYAGALTPSMSAGDVVIATEVLSDGRPLDVFECDATRGGLIESGAVNARSAGILAGVIVSSRQLASTPAAKAELLSLHPSALVVDMESAAVLREAASRGIGVTVVRAVSDPSNVTLPLDFASLVDSRGQVSSRRLALYVAHTPWCIPSVIKFGYSVHRASAALHNALVRLIAPRPESGL